MFFDVAVDDDDDDDDDDRWPVMGSSVGALCYAVLYIVFVRSSLLCL